MQTKFYVVNSDNLANQIMTAAALKEYQLQMSTGDFHTHTAVRTLPSVAEHYGYLDFDSETGELVDCCLA